MSSIFGGLENLATQTTETAIGFGLGVALANSLAPLATQLRQEAYSLDPIVAPDAAMLAAGVAQGQVNESEAKAWAAQHGIGGTAFDALVNIANTGPAVGQAMDAYRRGLLTDAQFETALQRAAIEPQWWNALKALKDRPLDPAEIAKAIHRGIIKGDGLLIASPPTAPGKVPAVPPSSLDPVVQAAWSGYSEEKLRILVGNAGLPPGLHEMLSLWNRGIVTKDDVQRAVAESNLRNEYQDVVLGLARQLLTPHEYAELVIRGWISVEEGAAGAAMHGMTQEDFGLLSKMIGRPIPIHQVTTGLARGGSFDGDRSHIPEAYLRSLQEGNLRPEWYSLAYANRYSLPSYFVVRGMVQDGSIKTDDAATIFEEAGWPPDLAKKAAASFSQGTASTAKKLTAAEWLTEYEGGYIERAELVAKIKALGYAPAEAEAYAELADARRAKSARNAVVQRIHTRYVGHKLTDQEAETDLAAQGVPEPAHRILLESWKAEREANVTRLTQAQIVKAFKKGVFDRPTTEEHLSDQGMDADDIKTLLDEQ